MTTTDYDKARRLLARRDPVIRDLIRRHGPCGLADAQHEDAFTALTHSIISQQLSTKAAATIARRFDALFGGIPTPAAVALVDDAQLRAVGLSSQKIRYIRDLCSRVADGSLTLEKVNELSDEDVIQSLTQITGIGRWTAEMFLMFRLHRPDVLPVDDLGILKAVQRAYGLRKLPRAERLTKIGEPWRPYRSVACWYLWASLENKPS
ncbi:MAG TPA: DNA-3-methyladenine glycosylase [Vicinamibacterales bacterium]|nr:DNA-3-methyladenine glycosylase [Vicinamibacterales bacterium]